MLGNLFIRLKQYLNEKQVKLTYLSCSCYLQLRPLRVCWLRLQIMHLPLVRRRFEPPPPSIDNLPGHPFRNSLSHTLVGILFKVNNGKTTIKREI